MLPFAGHSIERVARKGFRANLINSSVKKERTTGLEKQRRLSCADTHAPDAGRGPWDWRRALRPSTSIVASSTVPHIQSMELKRISRVGGLAARYSAPTPQLADLSAGLQYFDVAMAAGCVSGTRCDFHSLTTMWQGVLVAMIESIHLADPALDEFGQRGTSTLDRLLLVFRVFSEDQAGFQCKTNGASFGDGSRESLILMCLTVFDF